MDTRQVKAKQGLQWIISGFYLFWKVPTIWVLLSCTLLLITLALGRVPLLGAFISTLIFPVFLAGLMLGCKDLEQGKKLALSHLFDGFRKNVTPLITIGGIYLIGNVLIAGIVILIGGADMMNMLLYGERFDESEVTGVMSNILTASLVALTLSIPLMMAAWFSPLLVIFHNTPPIAAMQKSFFACLMNFIPFQIYGITFIIFVGFVAMTYGLGLVLLIPTIFASIYVSYKDIFLAKPLIMQDDRDQRNMQQATWSDTDQTTEKNDIGSSAIENNNTPDNEAVQCAHCGTYFPVTEAIKIEGRHFCCEEHARQHQSSSE